MAIAGIIPKIIINGFQQLMRCSLSPLSYNFNVMIIFLYGPDSYRRQEKLKEIISDYKKKHSGLSIQHFDLSDGSAPALFRNFLKSNSLFDSFKLGVIWGGEYLEGSEEKDFRKSLKENLEDKKSVLILIFEKKPIKDCAFLLKSPVIFQEFENLSGAHFTIFIQKEADKRELKIDNESLGLLARAFSGNSWGLVTELEKFSLLSDKKITSDTVRAHMDVFNEINIFDALNKIRSSRSPAERLKIFEELLVRNSDPAMLFNMIAISPYGQKEWKELMADYDASVKSGKLEYEEALLDMVLK